MCLFIFHTPVFPQKLHLSDLVCFSGTLTEAAIHVVPSALLLSCLVQLVEQAVAAGDPVVAADARRIGQYKEGEAVTAHDLASRIFHTVFMGTVNSSTSTRTR